MTQDGGDGALLTARHGGAPVSAQRLHDVGLVSRVTPSASLMDEALDMARAVLANGWTALHHAKGLFEASLDMRLDEALAYGHSVGAKILGRAEAVEGVAAFAGHRAAQFAATARKREG